MMNQEQILALSSDSGVSQRSLELATPANWSACGRQDDFYWAECKGSGKNPYRVLLDVEGPAFKCSCPSRQFPCKHGVGLYLYLARNPEAFASADPPAWAAEWLGKRREKQSSNTAGPPSNSKAASKAKPNTDKREQRVEAGLDEFKQWLKDVVRVGLAKTPTSGFGKQQAARLVDAQAGGLGARLRSLEDVASRPGPWQETLLMELGQLYFISQAFQQRDKVPENLRAELFQLVGFSLKKEDVLQLEPVSGRWLVGGVAMEQQKKLQVRRTWLLGSDGSSAMLLDFAFGKAAFETTYLAGTWLTGEIVYYPGALPQRAVAKSLVQTTDAGDPPPKQSFEGMLANFSKMLAVNPWLERVPAFLEKVIPQKVNEDWFVIDSEQNAIPLAKNEYGYWWMLALSGGHALHVFGEWDGACFLPLAIWSLDGSEPVSAA